MNKILILIILIALPLFSQNHPPKKEFRAVWVATVVNIDWPLSKTLTPAQQRSAYIQLLDRQKANGMNAILQQVRPSCDAFYSSAIEPWSEWLTGTQGLAPNPYYDPLEFQIEEAHKRGMELHAWFNPYRAKHPNGSSNYHSSHIIRRHPEWVVTYGTYRILDPGLPQVRNYVTSVIMDVVRRYDIDGVHFDDYFYPYPQTNLTFNDSATFANYSNGFTNLEDWRRNNVDLLIQMVNDSIKAVKPWVKFGISPFGIWRNISADPAGSATTGFQSYSGIFADSRKWLQQQWLDYMNPQIYWNIGFPAAAFDVLVPWWNFNANGRHIYAGHGAYKINDGTQSSAWLEPDQMPRQVRMTRIYPNVRGSVFFSSKSVTNNPLGFQDSLRNDLYKVVAITPDMPWIDSIPPLAPDSLNVVIANQRATISWALPQAASDGDTARRFIIYRFENDAPINLDDPRNIRELTLKDTTRFFDAMPIDTSVAQITYVVTSLDRMNNESAPAIKTIVLITDAGNETSIVSDYNLYQNYPNPFNPETKIKYSLSEAGKVTLRVYDLLGREVAFLVNKEMSSGAHEVIFNASELPAGIYFYQLKVNDYTATRKLTLLK
jgi:uncharacterized lipoprotein YddW (UPF0748 family)